MNVARCPSLLRQNLTGIGAETAPDVKKIREENRKRGEENNRRLQEILERKRDKPNLGEKFEKAKEKKKKRKKKK